MKTNKIIEKRRVNKNIKISKKKKKTKIEPSLRRKIKKNLYKKLDKNIKNFLKLERSNIGNIINTPTFTLLQNLKNPINDITALMSLYLTKGRINILNSLNKSISKQLNLLKNMKSFANYDFKELGAILAYKVRHGMQLTNVEEYLYNTISNSGSKYESEYWEGYWEVEKGLMTTRIETLISEYFYS